MTVLVTTPLLKSWGRAMVKIKAPVSHEEPFTKAVVKKSNRSW